MYQIDNSTAALAQPASTPAGTAGFFTDGNPAGGTAATIVPAEWLNAVMMELANLVTGAGLTLNKASFNQVQQAVQAYIHEGAFGRYLGTRVFTASGTYTPTAGTTSVIVGVIGGGGYGGASIATGAGQVSVGGGGGGRWSSMVETHVWILRGVDDYRRRWDWWQWCGWYNVTARRVPSSAIETG